MATSILTPALTEGYSSDININSGDHVTISIYPESGSIIEPGFYLTLERQNINGDYYKVTTSDMSAIQLKRDCNTIILVGEGTYRIFRPNLEELGITIPIGVQIG